MKLVISILTLSTFLYCTQISTGEKLVLEEKKESKLAKTYDSLKLEMANKKTIFKEALTSNSTKKSKVLSEAGIYLDSMICEELFPFWKGTTWDFNGHTNIPNEGEIACGYLVSTLLKHAGFNINRYKMAQQSSYNEIKTLSNPDSPEFLGTDYKKALEKIKSKPDGLYILGLSFHVGYIRVKDNGVYFLHSTYLSPTAVVNEKASESAAFMSSDVYYIGKISGNSALVKKWINSSAISIFKD